MFEHRIIGCRRQTGRHRAVAITLLAGSVLAAGAAAAQDFTGTYTITSSDGPLTLSITQNESSVTGLLIAHDGSRFSVDGDIVIDEGFEIEGVVSASEPTAEFSFYEDEEDGRFYLLIIPLDDAGIPDLAQAVEYRAERTSAAAIESDDPISTYSNESDVQSIGQTDGRLVGTWATQVIMNAQQGSVATQLFMEFRADGVLLDLGSRSMAGFPDAGIDVQDAGGQTAFWRTERDILYTALAGTPWVALARFEVAGDRLFLRYYDGDQKIWYRQ